MDAEAFERALERVQGPQGRTGGIGTLGERTLHAALKWYLEPTGLYHEVKIGPYVADIAWEDTIIEIQTRQLSKLREKLAFFLQTNIVTLVYPMERKKWLIWTDPESGEITKKRKSPKQGTFYQAFFELYRIKMLLHHENLRVRLLLIDMEEHRLLNGWSYDKKRGSTRWERIPVCLAGELEVGGAQGFGSLVPGGLEEPFTSLDFARAAGITRHHAQTALNVLFATGDVVRVGKQGRTFIYRIDN